MTSIDSSPPPPIDRHFSVSIDTGINREVYRFPCYISTYDICSHQTSTEYTLGRVLFKSGVRSTDISLFMSLKKKFTISFHPSLASIFTKDLNDFLRFKGVRIFSATPLFYSNRMITHCLEARGRYIIDDHTIHLQLCLLIVYIYTKKKIGFREERRERETRKGYM